jgi:hypothetical protein
MQAHGGRTNDAIRLAASQLLDILEEQIIVTSRTTPRPSGSWLFREKKSLPTHSKLLSWISTNKQSREDEKLTWLLATTRLADPPEAIRSGLLGALTTCFERIEKILPVKVPKFDDAKVDEPSAHQREAWRNVRKMCVKMEDTHRQLSKTWRRSCPHSHKALHFAINPYHSRTEGIINSSVLHDSSGWKQTSLQMTLKHEGTPDYHELCTDLNASANRPWHASKACGNCTKPVTFEHLLASWKDKNPPPCKDRLCLAVISSQLYLHLSGGVWWPYDRTDSVIHFQTADPRIKLALNSPIFSFASDKDIERRPDLAIEWINPTMPSLVEFGILLLEIMAWAPCSRKAGQREEQLQERLREIQHNSDFAHVDKILIAIIACTGYRGEDRLRAKGADIAIGKTIRNDDFFGSEFRDVVIENLEYVLRDAYQVDANTMFSLVE